MEYGLFLFLDLLSSPEFWISLSYLGDNLHTVIKINTSIDMKTKQTDATFKHYMDRLDMDIMV